MCLLRSAPSDVQAEILRRGSEILAEVSTGSKGPKGLPKGVPKGFPGKGEKGWPEGLMPTATNRRGGQYLYRGTQMMSVLMWTPK